MSFTALQPATGGFKPISAQPIQPTVSFPPVQPTQSLAGQIFNAFVNPIGFGANKLGLTNNLKNEAESGVNQAASGFQDIQQGAESKDVLGGAGKMLEGVGGFGAGLVNTALSPISAALKTIADKTGVHPVDAIAQTPIGQKLTALAQEHPELTKNLGNIFTILAPVLGGEFAPEIKGAAEAGTNLLKEGSSILVSKGSDLVGATKEAFVPSYTANEAAGKIAQGKIEDIQSTKEGIQNLSEVKNIKTHQDIVNATNKDIPVLSKQVDAEYAKNPTRNSIKDFEQTVGNGKNEIKVNYVKQAIQDLKTQYEKTNNAKGLSAVKIFENTAKINGLSYGDINNLSRLYGMEKSGFNANGELASGLSKQGFENTRQGLKATARSGLHGDFAQALDKKLSSLFDLRDIAQNNAEAVNKLQQATPKQGIVAKVANKAIDVGAGPLKYAAKKIGIGSEVNGKLNPIELQKEIPKHIETIRNEPYLPSKKAATGINSKYNNIKPNISKSIPK